VFASLYTGMTTERQEFTEDCDIRLAADLQT